MRPYKTIEAYCQSVTEQIRWKRAHKSVCEELSDHIIDQQEIYLGEGMSDNKALERAIEEMGDPVTVGAQMDRVHKPKAQWPMLILTMVMVIMGLVLRIVLAKEQGVYAPVGMQILSIIIGTGFLIGGYFMDFSIIGKYPKYILGVSFVTLVVILNFAPTIYGRAYIPLGIFGHISVIYSVLLLPIAVVALIYSMRDKGYLGIIVSGIGIIALAICILNIPVAYGFIQFALISLILLCTAIVKGWFGVNRFLGILLVLLSVIVGSIILIGMIYSSGMYYSDRIDFVLNPNSEYFGGYHSDMTKDILNESELVGAFSDENDLAYFAFDTQDMLTDYIVIALIAKGGWVLFILMISVIVLFVAKSVAMCFRQKSVLGLLLSLGIVMTFAMQTFGYVLYNLGYQFVAPMSLPFVSYGNTSLVVSMALVGLLLSIFRSGDEVKDCKRVYGPMA